MLFNSIAFFVFLGVVLSLYHALRHRAQNFLLLAASYVFYGAWDVRFLFLIAISTVLDYICGLMIGEGTLRRGDRLKASAMLVLASVLFLLPNWAGLVDLWESLGTDTYSAAWQVYIETPLQNQPWLNLVPLGAVAAAVLFLASYPRFSRMTPDRRRKTFFVVSMAGNLVILGFFKYFNFFIDSAEAGLATVGFNPVTAHLNIVLPVGISFYTFQTMSYTIDIYRGKLAPTRRFLDFALFVSFFPQLVAGPIERASALLPRIILPRQVTIEQVFRGVHLIIFGLFLKVAIADSVARSVDSIYGSPTFAGSFDGATWLDVVGATFLFAVQIYCDFAGYSAIARGVAKLFGIELMVNFARPYFATNPSEFWRRWHISLSSWLRDYLYIPLGGNRGGTIKTYRNLMLTMLLGGLWHGAAWTFVLWGAFHGMLLCVHRAWTQFTGQQVSADEAALAHPLLRGAVHSLKIICFFTLTCYGWLLFRAVSFAQIADFTTIIFTGRGGLELTMAKPTFSAALGLPLLLAYEITEGWAGSFYFYRRLHEPIRGLLYAAMIYLIFAGSINAPSQFIYFQF